jgi:hypothetical protein
LKYFAFETFTSNGFAGLTVFSGESIAFPHLAVQFGSAAFQLQF